MFKQGDQLLYAMSAKGHLSWADFKELFNILRGNLEQQEQTPPAAASTLWQKALTARTLDSLAHCDLEFEQSGGKIYVAPPLLVRLPTAGLPQAVLVGKRSPKSLFHLIEVCKKVSRNIEVGTNTQHLLVGGAPERITVQVESVEEMELVAAGLGITCITEPPAWTLLHFAGKLDDYLANCSWETANDLQWQRKDFDLSHLQFRRFYQSQEDYRLSRYIDPVRSTPIHFLWDGQRRAKVDVEWGRYALLRSKRLNILLYDKRKLILAELASVPIPRLLRRALALCSGYAPNFVPKEQLPFRAPDPLGINLFQDISPYMAKVLADKLGQKLKTQNIDLE